MSHPKHELGRLDAAARKSLSQNFLQSPHWADKLVDSVLAAPKPDEYWEIGPGLGALTERLLKKATAPVILYEYDRKFCELFREKHPEITLHEGDFLKTDLESHLGTKKVSLLSNLPYHLSSPILFQLMEYRHSFHRWVMTFQREFGERLLAKPDTSEYGAMSILIQLHMKVEKLGIIPPTAFYPAPKVDSIALAFSPKPSVDVKYDLIAKVVKTAFMHRRKKLISNLAVAFPKDRLAENFQALGLNPLVRPEVLSPETYLDLTSRLG